MKLGYPLLAVATFTLACSCAGPGKSGGAAPDLEVQIPGSKGGAGFDDLRYSPTLGKVLLGAGTAGVAAADVSSGEVQMTTGLSEPLTAEGGAGFIFAGDRGTNEVLVIDPSTMNVVAKKKLTATPDYVRFLESRREVWVTLPGEARIDVLSLSTASPPELTLAGTVQVNDGPEGLAFGTASKRAFVHLFAGKIAVIDVETREVTATWTMGCGSAHGIPIVDEARGLLFAGCKTAEIATLSLDSGEVKGHYKTEGGATILGYSPSLHHFYLRADPGVPVTILAVGADGALSKLGTADATMRGHCATSDDKGHVWVCDEEKGRLLRFTDPFPKTE